MLAKDFLDFKNWVVAGDVLNNTKYAYRILISLKEAGYNALGVNPRSADDQVYKSLKDISSEIQVLDLCINPKSGITIIKEAKELGIKNVLIQPGAESDEIIEYCKHNGITAIEGCALVELARR